MCINPKRIAEYQRITKERNLQKDNLKKELSKVKSICLDELLYGNPDFKCVQKFFLENEFDSEEYLIKAIRKHLLTKEQEHISIENCLNGNANFEEYTEVYESWNKKLEFFYFGM